MNPWYILKIDKTDDKNAVKTAYMTLLPKHNPEVDPEGFTKLRSAYEEALKEIDSVAESDAGGNDAVSIFFNTLDALYKDFSKRITPTLWEEALESDVCTALDMEEEVDYKMLEFLSRNFNLPTSVWVVLNDRFLWTERADQLRQRYNPGFINSIISSVDSKFDLHYELFDYDPGADVDRFIFLRNSLAQAIDDRKKEDADPLLEEIKGIGVRHPVYDFELARYLAISEKAQEAFDIVDGVLTKHPEFDNEPFALYTKASVLLAFDDNEKLEEAIKIYEQALEIVPNYYFAQLGIADTLIKQEKYDEAEKYLTDVMLPENPSHGYLFSLLMHIRGLNLKKYETLYAEDPTSEVIEKLAQCYSYANEHDKCIELLINTELNGKKCYFLGFSYSKREEYDLAIKYSLESIEMEPTYNAYILLSGIYIDRRYYQDAADNADRGLSAGLPEDGVKVLLKARLLSDKAYAYKKLGKYDQALKVIDEAIAFKDGMCEVYADKAEILMDMGQFREAFIEAEKSMFLMPNWSRPYELQMDIYYRAGNFDQMLHVFTKTEELQIKSPGLNYFMGCRAGALKEYDKCQEILDSVLAEENLGIWEDRALEAICHYAFNAQNYENAVIYSEKLIEFYEKNDFIPSMYAFTDLARAYRCLENTDKELESLLRGLEALADNERILTQLGYYYENTNLEKSYNTWQRLIEVSPMNSIPYNRIAMLLRKDNKNQEALDVLNQGLEKMTDNVNLLGRRGFIYSSMKEYSKAVSDFVMAAENPDHQTTWWEKGAMYFEAARLYWSELNLIEPAKKYFFLAEEHGIDGNWKIGFLAGVYEWLEDYEKAIALSDKCIANDPNDAFAIYTRGFAYKRMGNTEKANEDFCRAIELSTSDTDKTHDMHRIAGSAYLERDEPKEARIYFELTEESVKTDGTKDGICACIHQNWARYYMYTGDYQKALEQINLAIDLANSVRNNGLKQKILALASKESGI